MVDCSECLAHGVHLRRFFEMCNIALAGDVQVHVVLLIPPVYIIWRLLIVWVLVGPGSQWVMLPTVPFAEER